jgi:acetyl esterase/lipase
VTELLVGSRVPDVRQVLVDLILRYRMKRGAHRPLTPAGMTRAAARFETANGRVPVPPFVAIEPVKIGSLDGEWISLRDQAPSGSVILYFHGGGFVMGSPKTHRSVTWRLARAGACWRSRTARPRTTSSPPGSTTARWRSSG